MAYRADPETAVEQAKQCMAAAKQMGARAASYGVGAYY